MQSGQSPRWRTPNASGPTRAERAYCAEQQSAVGLWLSRLCSRRNDVAKAAHCLTGGRHGKEGSEARRCPQRARPAGKRNLVRRPKASTPTLSAPRKVASRKWMVSGRSQKADKARKARTKKVRSGYGDQGDERPRKSGRRTRRWRIPFDPRMHRAVAAYSGSRRLEQTEEAGRRRAATSWRRRSSETSSCRTTGR